jgi:hypothetical protein
LNDLRSRADLNDDVNALSKDLLSDKSDCAGKIIASSKRKDKIKDLANLTSNLNSVYYIIDGKKEIQWT